MPTNRGTRAALATFSDHLVAPSRHLRDRSERRTARLVATVLVVLAPLAVFSIVLQLADGEAEHGSQGVVVVAVVVIAVAYALSRTRHVPVAAAITTLLPTAGGIAVLVAQPSDPGWFAFMALNPAFGTMLLPFRWAMVLALGNVGAVAVAALAEPALDNDTAVVAVMFNAITAAVLLVGAEFRDRQEQDRRADLVARQRLHERVLDGTFGGIAVVRDGVVTETNEAFGALVGVRSADVVGRRLISLFHADVADTLDQAVDEPAARPVEVELVRLDRSVLHAEMLVRGTDDRDDAAVVVALRDVTERRRAADALRRAERMESVGRLAASLVHDTNNELFIIVAHADQLIAEQEASGRTTDAARAIVAASERISTMLRRVLVLGRDETAELQPIDVTEFVAERAQMWQQVLGRGIELRVVEAGARVASSDAARLEQLLLNLVLNARDAIEDTGHVWIETAEVTIGGGSDGSGDLPAGTYQRITVADDGRGIADGDLERVFDPFFTTKSDGRGTGLGLYTSRQIAEQAGGTLTVAPRLRGTAFTILLPAAAPPSALNDGS